MTKKKITRWNKGYERICSGYGRMSGPENHVSASSDQASYNYGAGKSNPFICDTKRFSRRAFFSLQCVNVLVLNHSFLLGDKAFTINPFIVII